jgi:glycosyltransferase involved in cell wall biosynthesis
MKKMKILDFYCHQGNQYEFFKTGHNFFLVSPDSKKPNWNAQDRPLPSNVVLLTEQDAFKKLYDIVIVRSPIHLNRYMPFIRRGSIPVAVVQTTSPYPVPKEVKHVVWNCKEAMTRHSGYYGKKTNHYIVHGFDPSQFLKIKMNVKSEILTVANSFKQRSQIMGYDLWRAVANHHRCNLIGHGNDGIKESLGKAKNFKNLVEAYNSYQVFFNPTVESAMPRSRGEALMCGAATVSTSGFDIKNYFTDKKNIMFADTSSEMISSITRLLENPSLSEDMGELARETALKHFHISDYINKWNQLFDSL